METTEAKQSTAGNRMNWVLISGIAFLVSLSASVILIFFGNRLDALGIVGNIYYIILIPLGLSCAAFLAGAMKSYAAFKSNTALPYGSLHLAGPVVIFALVVGGGFIMPNLNKQATSFDLKIRVFGEDKPTSAFNEGSINIHLGKNTYNYKIHGGEVLVPNIPITFHNKKARIIPEIKEYHLAGPEDILISKNNDNVYIKLVREAASLTTVVRGTIIDEKNAPVRNAVLNFASGLAMDTTDENGDFACSVPMRAGESVPLKILVNGIVRFKNDVTLSSSIPYDFKLNTKH